MLLFVAITGRPKNAKLYIDATASTRNLFNNQIYPIFFSAGLTASVEGES